MSLIKGISVDELIDSELSTPKNILEYFEVGRKFKVGIIDNLDLLPMGNGFSNKSIIFEDDLVMEAQNVGENNYRWLVYTKPDGSQFGKSVEAMLVQHRKEQIEIYPLEEHE